MDSNRINAELLNDVLDFDFFRILPGEFWAVCWCYLMYVLWDWGIVKNQLQWNKEEWWMWMHAVILL